MLGTVIRPIILIQLFFNSFFLYSGNEIGNPYIRNYLPEEYQAAAQSWAIIQDHRGVLFIGNSEGILEFNGRNWNLITMPNHSTVRGLDMDTDGTIYVGASNDVGYLAIDTSGKRYFVSLKDGLPAIDRETFSIWYCLAANQRIYFFTEGKIFCYDRKKFTVIKMEFFWLVGQHPHQQIFLFDIHKNLYCLKDNSVELAANTSQLLKNKPRSYAVLPWPQQPNTVLLVTEADGFFLVDLQKPADQRKPEKFPSSICGYIEENDLRSAIMIHPDLYAFGTLRGGIVLMDGQGQLIQIINKNRGLMIDTVYGLFADREQNLWATSNAGISYIRLNSPLTRFNHLNGLEGDILSVIRYHGRLYVGNHYGVFYLPNYQMKNIQDNHCFMHVANTKSECFAFYSPRKNLLLASSFQGYLQIIDDKAFNLGKGWQAMCFGTSKKFPDHVFAGSFYGLEAIKIISKEDRDHSSDTKNPNSVLPIRIHIENQGSFKAIHDGILAIEGSENGDLWLTTWYKGILQLKFQSDRVSDFDIIRYTDQNGLPNLNWPYVFQIDQQIMAGTFKGIYKVSSNDHHQTNNPQFHFVPELTFGKKFADDGLIVEYVKKDKNGWYWVNLNRDFGIITPDSHTGYHWDNTLFKPIQGNISSFIIEDNGIAWLCGSQGAKSLYRFDSTINNSKKAPYSALISTVTAENNRILFAGCYYQASLQQGKILTQSSLLQPDALKPTLEYTHNSLSFTYAAAFYEHEEHNRFSWKLVNFRNTWSEWSSENRTSLVNIPEGNYTFQVKAKNIWEQESIAAEFQFNILPPWQRTWWAFISYVFFLIILFMMGIRFNSRRISAAKKKLEGMVTERTQQLVAKNKKIYAQKEKIEMHAEELKTARDALWGEMELAKKIQTVLLPKEPHIPGYEIAAYMQPADEVGGDYYDVICIDNNDRRGGSCARPQSFGQPQRADPKHPNIGNHRELIQNTQI
jgi:hypothetical protein